MNPSLISNRPCGSDIDQGELNRTMGQRLRRARLAKRWTQEDVADSLGVTSEFYARVERGHSLPSLRNLVRLADLLRISVDVMFGFQPFAKLNVQPDPETSRWRKLVRRLRRVPVEDIGLVLKVIDRLEQAESERTAHALRKAQESQKTP